jgi:hypothetical protein
MAMAEKIIPAINVAAIVDFNFSIGKAFLSKEKNSGMRNRNRFSNKKI